MAPGSRYCTSWVCFARKAAKHSHLMAPPSSYARARAVARCSVRWVIVRPSAAEARARRASWAPARKGRGVGSGVGFGVGAKTGAPWVMAGGGFGVGEAWAGGGAVGFMLG